MGNVHLTNEFRIVCSQFSFKQSNSFSFHFKNERKTQPPLKKVP